MSNARLIVITLQHLVLVAISLLGTASIGLADNIYVNNSTTVKGKPISQVMRVSPEGSMELFATFSTPVSIGIAFDVSGNIFTSGDNTDEIDKITPEGEVTAPFTRLASRSFPQSLAFNRAGDLFIACNLTHEIDRMTPDGKVSLFAMFPEDSLPWGLAFRDDGDLYVTDAAKDAIYRVTPDGKVNNFAKLPAGADAPGIVVDADGNLFVPEYDHDLIDKISPTGEVSLFATLPPLSGPIGLAFDSNGILYESGLDGSIRKILSDGSVHPFARAVKGDVLAMLAFTDDAGHPLVLPGGPGSGPSPGDANGDGKVDLADFGILKSNFGSGTTAAQGDFNGDGAVDLTDFGILKNNFGKSVQTAVPEPSTLALLAVGMLSLGAVRRR